MAADVTVSSARNLRHIADTWFTTRKHLIYRLHRLDQAAETGDNADAGGGRLALIPRQTECRHVDWYLSNVAVSAMLTPNTTNPLHFGILQVRYGPYLRPFHTGKKTTKVWKTKIKRLRKDKKLKQNSLKPLSQWKVSFKSRYRDLKLCDCPCVHFAHRPT